MCDAIWLNKPVIRVKNLTIASWALSVEPGEAEYPATLKLNITLPRINFD